MPARRAVPAVGGALPRRDAPQVRTGSAAPRVHGRAGGDAAGFAASGL